MMSSGEQSGFTLVELAVGLAISAILIVPLSGVALDLIRIPVGITNRIIAVQGIQHSALVLNEDASRAQSFTPGQEPQYGEFSWLDLGAESPVQVTARYLYDPELRRVERVLTRGADVSSPVPVLEDVDAYGDVVFTITPPAWAYDQASKRWSYAQGRVDISFSTARESGSQLQTIVTTSTLVTNSRPQAAVPASLPAIRFTHAAAEP